MVRIATFNGVAKVTEHDGTVHYVQGPCTFDGARGPYLVIRFPNRRGVMSESIMLECDDEETGHPMRMYITSGYRDEPLEVPEHARPHVYSSGGTHLQVRDGVLQTLDEPDPLTMPPIDTPPEPQEIVSWWKNEPEPEYVNRPPNYEGPRKPNEDIRYPMGQVCVYRPGDPVGKYVLTELIIQDPGDGLLHIPSLDWHEPIFRVVYDQERFHRATLNA